MAEKKNPLGPTGLTVASNVKLWRERRMLSLAEFARRLEALDRPIPVLGLAHIEQGKRRVDSDDLVALAVVLRVSPLTLLLPATDAPESPTVMTAIDLESLSEKVGIRPAETAWLWALCVSPLPSPRLVEIAAIPTEDLDASESEMVSEIGLTESIRAQRQYELDSRPIWLWVDAMTQDEHESAVADAAEDRRSGLITQFRRAERPSGSHGND